MGHEIERIQQKINSFKRKYYLDLLVKGSLITLSILFLYFLVAALLEYLLWLNPWVRFSILLSFIGTCIYCIHRFLKSPLEFWIANKGLGVEQSAKIIGNSFPNIKDRLLNLIQLSSQESGLAAASIKQKYTEFEPIAFESVIHLNQNKKYVKYLIVPLGVILLLLFINQKIITQSTQRIINFNQKFSPEAPFTFNILNKSLIGFFNEDFVLKISLKGEAIPDGAYLIIGSQRMKMENQGNGDYQYTFEKIQQAKSFQIEAAGFFSSQYEIQIVNRPELTQFEIELQYPKYLQRKNEKVINAGTVEVPEGTVLNWKVRTANTQEASIFFYSDSSLNSMQSVDDQVFIYKKGFKENDQYTISLQNENSKNKDRIGYAVDVIKDQFPQLTISSFKDSILYKRIILGGIALDDYGITQLKLLFHVKDEDQKIVYQRNIEIPIIYNQSQQSFFYNWNLDTLSLKPGQQLEYYLQVWDNDGVNGRKSTRSANYTFLIPDKDQLITDIAHTQSQTEQSIEKGVNKAEELKNQIDEAYQKLKGKQNLDWHDKKKLENIIDQKKALDQIVDQLKEQNKVLEQKKDAFTEQDERIKEKAEQIQKLMDELLDDETKKLIAELEKLLKENADTSQIESVLQKLNQNSNNLEKELERTLELFKQLQFDFKLDQAIKSIQDQTEKQNSLKEKTESVEKDLKDKKKSQSLSNDDKEKIQELAEDQEKLKDEFKKEEENLDELRELGKELEQEEVVPDEEQTKEIEQSQEESEQNLKQNDVSKAKESQKKALEKMQQMKNQMEAMQGSMEMKMDMQNIESLRQIIHGLIKISYDQENLIDKFRELEQNDPRFNGLAQQQLKLKDDVKVLEDSLLALSKRDPMMSSFVTREITELNSRLDKTIEDNKERRRQQAATDMQFSMTSINNLALMLDSHFDMMMKMMANARPSKGKSKQKGKEQSLSQMQQQLNQKIEQLKGSGKSGRQLSEELAEMAAEQERIRKALQDMQNKMKEGGGPLPGNDLPGKMEQTETELVNKQLTDQLIQRQREILTRLLESEKSAREQDMDEERKGETAKDYEKQIPASVEEYLRLKEKEVELLKTVPPKLYPYYKKEVREYFKRIGNN